MSILNAEVISYLRQYIVNSVMYIFLIMGGILLTVCLLAVWSAIIAFLIVVYVILTPIVLIKSVITDKKIQRN